jgi:hypothetical protein
VSKNKNALGKLSEKQLGAAPVYFHNKLKIVPIYTMNSNQVFTIIIDQKSFHKKMNT